MKSLVWILMAFGSWLGGMIPMLWHADFFSFSSIVFSALGGLAGIYLGYRLSQ